MEEGEYLTITEATRLFKISHTVLYRLKKNGKLKFYRQEAPRRILIKRSELESLRQPK